MRDNKGITLTTLIIYVIGITLLLGIVSTITRFIYRDISLTNINSQNLNEYVKFNMYFLEDIKEKNNSIYEVSTNTIIFQNGNQYSFTDNAIYKNYKKICNNITDLQFEVNVDNITGNVIISVLFTVGEVPEYTKMVNYTMLSN